MKKLWSMKVTTISIITGAFGTVTKGLVQRLENNRTSGYHLNYSIIEVGQNTEKSPVDLSLKVLGTVEEGPCAGRLIPT